MLCKKEKCEGIMNNNHYRKARILIVEDQKVNILLLKQMLMRNRYKEIETVTDSRKAIETYLSFKPDILLLDLMMPHVDGFQIMEELGRIEKASYLPILVLTALTDQESRIRALQLGAKDFINKPFDQMEVLVRIQNMLEVRMLHNTLRDQNKILESKISERTKDLQETQLEIVHRLGRAAEYRDNETGMHIIRMSLYAALLAQAVGLSEEESELLMHAAPMHDIGKIGVPDHILLKPGALSEEDWIMMKKHPEIGAELLGGSNSHLLQMAEKIALNHQEKWDGSGYPQGLKGEEIPIESRIITIVDVFDALTSERPYKGAWTSEDAMAEINRGSGSHFDPNLVEKFKSILPEVLMIQEEYADMGK